VVVSDRRTLSDVNLSQEALIERLRQDNQKLAGMVADVLAALTERRTVTASETVELSRAGTSGNPTMVKVAVVVQDGETLADAEERARLSFEAMCARFPLPSGFAHAHELGPEPTLREQLEASVHQLKPAPDPEEAS
jgi:hypothetical protein